jgi:HEAT repeat protein
MRVCSVCHTVAPYQATVCPEDQGALQEVAELPNGALLNGYRVVRRLGVGGMGKVYEAEHVSLGRRVALKVLLPRYARDREALKRFLSEAKAVNLIRHENIINIYDISSAPSGDVYFVMELLSGEDLGVLLQREGRFSETEALEVAIAVAKALSVAHQGGVVHRDLKPANIFFARRPNQTPLVKLLDFGLAKLGEEPDAGPGGPLLGTPHYMAPEYIRGAAPSPATDQYSFGVLLFRMVTGQRPFEGQDPIAIFRSQIRDAIPDARQLRPELSPALGDIITRTLQKDPAARFPGMTSVLLALQKLQDARVEKPSRVPVVGRVDGRWALAIGGAALLLAGAVWWMTRPAAPVAAVVVPGPPSPKEIATGALAEVSPESLPLVLSSLENTRGDWAGPLLFPHLSSPNLDVRRAAAQAVGRARPAGSKEALIETGGAKPSLEWWVARFGTGDEAARVALVGFLGDPARRMAAAQALVEGGERDGAELLRRALVDGLLSPERSLAAARALAALGDEEGGRWLTEAAQRGEFDALAARAPKEEGSLARLVEAAPSSPAALRALSQLGDSRAFALLLRDLSGPGSARREAALCLPSYATRNPLRPEEKSALQAYLSDPDPIVRFGVSAALLASGSEGATKGPL